MKCTCSLLMVGNTIKNKIKIPDAKIETTQKDIGRGRKTIKVSDSSYMR